jgi:hypothetical protein
MSSTHPLRVLAKALVLFVLANLVFAFYFPPVGYLSIYNRFIPGRLRFDVQLEPPDQFNRDVLVLEDLPAMFSAHILAADPQPAREYRVVFLGDSSIWGFSLPASEIITEQINKLGLVACDGRRIAAYDAAYPLPSFMRDLLILEEAVKYKPDLIVWPVTLLTFQSRRADLNFLRNQPDHVLGLVQRYDLTIEAEPYLHPSTLLDRTVIGQRVRLKKILMEQIYGLRWLGTDMRTRLIRPQPLSSNVEAGAAYYEFASAADLPALASTLQFGAIEAGLQIAGDIPVLLLNEPIYVAQGENSTIRYNGYYPRWAYDEYRRRMADWIRVRGVPYIDLWDAVPAEDFIDSPLHLSGRGERRMAGLLAPEILKLACP